MRVTTNSKLIRRRARLGTIASFGGIAVLAGGMIASFRPQFIWVSFAALLIGFVLAQYGSYNLRRWGRSPRPDQVLEEALKGFDDRYHLYAWSLPSPFVLLGPQGAYTLTTRDQTGPISVTGSTWKTKFTVGRALMFFASEGLGNPTEEARSQAARLTQWIRTKLPDQTLAAQPVIIFIDPRAQLTASEPTIPVVDAKNLKKWLRGTGKGDTLKANDFRALEALFEETATAAR